MVVQRNQNMAPKSTNSQILTGVVPPKAKQTRHHSTGRQANLQKNLSTSKISQIAKKSMMRNANIQTAIVNKGERRIDSTHQDLKFNYSSTTQVRKTLIERS
jgi:hypothetical protein